MRCDWKERIDNYIIRADHRNFSKTPTENEWMAIANILAHSKKRRMADETDIVRAIIRISNSSTLGKLKAELFGKGIDEENWDEIVLNQDKKRSHSSF